MVTPKPQPPKPCQECGTLIQWTKNLALEWSKVKYCSNQCKRTANRTKLQTEQPAEFAGAKPVKRKARNSYN